MFASRLVGSPWFWISFLVIAFGFHLGRAIFFPKNTPRAVIDRMNAAVRKALDSADIKTFMTREALDAIASSPEELTAKFKSDQARYAKVIKAANIKAE